MNNYVPLFVFDGNLGLKSWPFPTLAEHTVAQDALTRCAVLDVNQILFSVFTTDSAFVKQ